MDFTSDELVILRTSVASQVTIQRRKMKSEVSGSPVHAIRVRELALVQSLLDKLGGSPL